MAKLFREAAMTDDLIELQTRISFQGDTLQQLNDVIVRQQQEIDELNRQLVVLKQSVKQINDQSSGSAGHEAPPPHY